MAQQMWKPVEEDYWGYINVERKGTTITVCLDAEFERDNGYLVVPLPDNLRMFKLADAPDALTVVMTAERIEALQMLINVAAALPHIAVPARQRNNAAKLLQTMIDELEATE